MRALCFWWLRLAPECDGDGDSGGDNDGDGVCVVCVHACVHVVDVLMVVGCGDDICSSS